MKKITIFLITSLVLFCLSFSAFANLSDSDKAALEKKINMIEDYINGSNTDGILNLISENADPEFKEEIKDTISGKKNNFSGGD